jgi:magnesium-transporting ATPase (P-type)
MFLGLFGITDSPREEAAPAIALCHHAGIAVKMITGDHALTAAAIGRVIGLANPQNVLTGADIDNLTDQELEQVVEDVSIYARMFPHHKLRLVTALQKLGHVVAMTGDGVNDAPALKAADVGIAMGKQGTEVAKDAARIVLADDNFASIAAAVEEGRNIYKNLRYTIQFMLVTDFAEGLSLIISLLAGLTLPITPLQILWVNTVTSVTLSLAFAFAPHHKDAMNVPPIRQQAPFFNVRKIVSLAFHIMLIALGTIAIFQFLEPVTGEAVARTAAVNALIGFQVWYLWSLFPMRTARSESWVRHYAPVLLASVGTAILQIGFCYAPWMQKIFGTAGPDTRTWLIVVLATGSILIWHRAEAAIGYALRSAKGAK